MTDLAGANAFVTGAADGIGRAIANSLARAGVAVAIADINAEAAKAAAEAIESSGGRAVAIACDVTDAASIEAAADAATDALGPIRVLVNNAGAFQARPFEETKLDDWQWLLDVNVLGVVRGLHTFVPRMRAHGQPSHIVNTASVSGHIATPTLSVYTATKFAVMGLTESLRAELKDSSIGLSVLCPGIVNTGLVESSARHRPGPDDASGGESAMRAVMNETGTDPAPLGDDVVNAIRNDQFYVFTHPSMRPAFVKRFDDILRSYPES